MHGTTMKSYKKLYTLLVFTFDMPLCCIYCRAIISHHQCNYLIYHVLSEDKLQNYKTWSWPLSGRNM